MMSAEQIARLLAVPLPGPTEALPFADPIDLTDDMPSVDAQCPPAPAAAAAGGAGGRGAAPHDATAASVFSEWQECEDGDV